MGVPFVVRRALSGPAVRVYGDRSLTRGLVVTLEAMPQLNAIGIVVSDMARSIRFYRLLGIDVPETPDEGHLDSFLPNGVRFMLDQEEEVRSFRPDWTRETGNQLSLAFQCESAAEVDETYARVTEAGFHGEKEPWDAFWGQRYAQLQDPDGVPGRPVRRALGDVVERARETALLCDRQLPRGNELEGSDIADDEQGGTGEPVGRGRELCERRPRDLLVAEGPARDRGCGRVGRQAARDEPFDHAFDAVEAHEEDEGAADRCEPRVLGVAAVGSVATCDRDTVGDTAMGDRNPRRGGNGGDRGDSGHDLGRDSGIPQRQCLLAAAAEDERVATLQTDDVESRPPVVDEQLVQRFLAQAVTGDDARVGRCLGDELGCNEAVVHEHVAGPDQIEPASGDQTGVARACSDEVNGHPSSSRTMPAKKSRRAS